MSAPEREEVEAIVNQEVAAVENGDIQTYLDLLDKTAIFLPPNQSQRAGADLRRWLREFLDGFAVEWLFFSHHKIDVSKNAGVRSCLLTSTLLY